MVDYGFLTFVVGVGQTVALTASLGFLYFQIRASTRSTKASTYQSIIDSFARLEERISRSQETGRLYDDGRKNGLESLSEGERRQFREIMATMFTLFEAMYDYFENGLIEKTVWGGWCRYMREQLDFPGVANWWKRRQHVYGVNFRKYVDSGSCPVS